MYLDTRTIFFMAAAICLPVAGLLFMSWWQNRAERTLLWWSGAFFVSSAGLSLYFLRGRVPDLVTIDVANALVVAGIAFGWAGARAFNGKRVPVPVLLAAPAAWLAGCRIPAIYDELSLRIILFSVIYAAGAFAAAFEYWRGRADGLLSRYALVGTFTLLGLIYVVRTAAVAGMPPQRPADYLHTDPAMALFVMLPVVLAVANAVLVIAATKDRAEAAQRLIAETDPLTGIFNRGATLGRAGARLATGGGAILLFDLDRFKQINDTFGHPAGDRVLAEFAAVAAAELGQADVFGRIGGEEFLAFLPGATEEQAVGIAERIRAGFADTRIEKSGVRVAATVSIGIATTEAPSEDIVRC